MNKKIWIAILAFIGSALTGIAHAAETPKEIALFVLPYVKNVESLISLSQIDQPLKKGEKRVVLLPSSHGVLFTDGTHSDAEVEKQTQEVLAKMSAAQEKEPAKIEASLRELKEVVRASFVCRQGQWQRVTDEKQLQLGETIWCKTEEQIATIPYQSEEQCLVAIRNAGLRCEEIRRPSFYGKVKYQMWRTAQGPEKAKLGEAYILNHPFTLFVISKD